MRGEIIRWVRFYWKRSDWRRRRGRGRDGFFEMVKDWRWGLTWWWWWNNERWFSHDAGHESSIQPRVLVVHSEICERLLQNCVPLHFCFCVQQRLQSREWRRGGYWVFFCWLGFKSWAYTIVSIMGPEIVPFIFGGSYFYSYPLKNLISLSFFSIF